MVTGLKETKLELSCELLIPGWLAFTATDQQAGVGGGVREAETDRLTTSWLEYPLEGMVMMNIHLSSHPLLSLSLQVSATVSFDQRKLLFAVIELVKVLTLNDY